MPEWHILRLHILIRLQPRNVLDGGFPSLRPDSVQEWALSLVVRPLYYFNLEQFVSFYLL